LLGTCGRVPNSRIIILEKGRKIESYICLSELKGHILEVIDLHRHKGYRMTFEMVTASSIANF